MLSEIVILFVLIVTGIVTAYSGLGEEALSLGHHFQPQMQNYSNPASCTETFRTEGQSNATLYLWAINARDGYSYPECWGMRPNFTVSNEEGLQGALALNLGRGSAVMYNRWTKALNASLHGPIANQYVLVLTGSALVHFPNVPDKVKIVAGQIVIAIDNSSISSGHYTEWAAGSSAVLIQFQNGLTPPHSVVELSHCG